MPIPENFQFSQHSLQDYVNCPRRFQLKYLDEVIWPAPVSEPVQEQERLMRMGADFHRLIYQYFCGISSADIKLQIQDPQLEAWWMNFEDFLPKIQTDHLLVEHARSTLVSNYRCVSRFDLVIVENDNQVRILDWKTSSQVPRLNYLETRIQTLLYPYVLCKSGSLPFLSTVDPDQVTMTYWYVNFPHSPIHFQYSRSKMGEGEAKIEQLLDQINNSSSGEFNMTLDLQQCKFCNYRSLCDRGIKAGLSAEMEDDDAKMEDEIQDLDPMGEITF